MIHSSRYLVQTKASFFLLLLSVVFWPGSAVALVEPEDVNKLAEKTQLVVNSFYKESFDLRMQYEYSRRFITSEHREQLQQVAKGTSDKLKAISIELKALRKHIEEYEGQDWEILYGQTGLWRKLSWDINITDLAECQIDYYLAITLQDAFQSGFIEQLKERIMQVDSKYSTADSKLLMAKTFALLSKKEPRYKDLALKELEVFMIYSDVKRPISAAIEKLKLLETAEPEQLNSLINLLSQNRGPIYLELVLSVAFLQRSHDIKGFEKTIELFPEIENQVGIFSLGELSALFKEQQLFLKRLQQTSVLEIEIAAAAAWTDEPENNKELLQKFWAVDKFRTPLVTYVTAASLAQSSPPESVELLIVASQLQKQTENKRLFLSASGIAEQGAWLGFSLLESDKSYCQITNQAFENYFKITGRSANEELEYLYSAVLKECGQADKSRELLQRIADRDEGEWRQKAIMELAADSIRQKQHQTMEQKQTLLNQIAGIINNDNKQEYCNYASEINIILHELTFKIEQVENDVSDFSLLLSRLITCAEFCYNCSEGPEKYGAGLAWGELLAFAGSKRTQRSFELQDFIESSSQEGHVEEVDLLRYRARLLMIESQFSQAAKIWALICDIQKNEAVSEKQRSWEWWRAKFYEIYCCQQIPDFDKKNLLHTIEILETTYPEIPPLWSEKLNSLKK